MIVPNRADNFPSYIKWLNKHDVDTSSVSIQKFEKEEYGLQAEKDIKVEYNKGFPTFACYKKYNI